MNFQFAVNNLINRNGKNVVLIYVTEGEYDPSTSTVVNTEKSYSVKAYPKNTRANQFNYPDLVGRELIEFMFDAADLPKCPEPMDKVVYEGKTYSVKSSKTAVGHGKDMIYRALCVK